jgi:DNA-binding NtrC family response regulator
MKILIIDDDLEICDMLKTFFESLGHEAKTVSIGSDALKQVVMIEPDVVFLDIRLPDKDGIDLLKEIKEVNKMLPVVVMTGYKEAEKVIDAFRFGALDCLLKPFNFDYIKNLLMHVKVKR